VHDVKIKCLVWGRKQGSGRTEREDLHEEGQKECRRREINLRAGDRGETG